MAHKKELITTGSGYKVKNGTTETTVINQDGTSGNVVGANGTVSAQAATATLTNTSAGLILTNTGASGTIVLTLPAVDTMEGETLKVQVTAAQIVRLLPATGEAIYLGGSGVVTKYLNIAAVIGNYVDLYCDGTQYLVTNYSGVVTKEA